VLSNLATIIAFAALVGGIVYLLALVGKNDPSLPKPSNVFWAVFTIVAFLFLINGALGW
jgi:hypothetical protein